MSRNDRVESYMRLGKSVSLALIQAVQHFTAERNIMPEQRKHEKQDNHSNQLDLKDFFQG
jgi:hypothetical protein